MFVRNTRDLLKRLAPTVANPARTVTKVVDSKVTKIQLMLDGKEVSGPPAHSNTESNLRDYKKTLIQDADRLTKYLLVGDSKTKFSDTLQTLYSLHGEFVKVKHAEAKLEMNKHSLDCSEKEVISSEERYKQRKR